MPFVDPERRSSARSAFVDAGTAAVEHRMRSVAPGGTRRSSSRREELSGPAPQQEEVP
jgi:hypothetical protein